MSRGNGGVIGPSISTLQAKGVWALPDVQRAQGASAWPLNAALPDNGLIVHLDSALSSSYPGTGTTWTNLADGTNNATITGSPTFNSTTKAFTFVDDNALMTKSHTLTAATFAIWQKRAGTQTSFAGIMYNRASPNIFGMQFNNATGLLGYTWNNTAATYNFNSGLSAPDATWALLGVSISATSATVFVNKSKATNNTTHASQTMAELRVGQDDEGVRYYKGDIGKVFVWNRALSSAEIDAVYDTYKVGFGL